LVARLGRSCPGATARRVVAHCFVKQMLIHGRGENFIGEIQRADHFIIEIDNIYAWHGGYLFALRTTTYPPLGPGTAPFTMSTLSSASTCTISRLRTVTCCVPI